MMNNHKEIITQLVNFIDKFDTYGNLKRDMSLFSITIGTLRKDRSIALDILKNTTPECDGLGAIALSRILIEDYLHLVYLNDNSDDSKENIDRFNIHPKIENYLSLKSMENWGFEIENTLENKVMIEDIKNEFNKNKNKFLRRKESDNGFDADDYYRTWTCTGLDKLISKTDLTKTDNGRKSLKYMTEMYSFGSNVIHHNSFLIWLLACQDKRLITDEYSDIALNVTFNILSNLINLTIEISQTIRKDEKIHGQLLDELADIMEGKNIG